VPATFFVVGRYVEERPQLVRRMHEAGHELGNHTFDHIDAAHEREDRAVREQIERTTETILAAAGVAPTLMRPPYGKNACRVSRIAGELGLDPTVLWSVEAWDWDVPATDTASIRSRILEDVHPGAIVLLHDGAPPYDATDRQGTVDAVGDLVPKLIDRGFELVTVSQLLSA
jgi:peptidoglycan/xylan/chitin deacetylase (PgdA/CDA1 family)